MTRRAGATARLEEDRSTAARDAARRAQHGDAWADAVADLAAAAPARLTDDQARVVKRHLACTATATTAVPTPTRRPRKA